VIAGLSAQLDQAGPEHPAFDRLLASRGSAHARLGHLPEALADYTKAIRHDASDHSRCMEGGSLLAYLGEKEAFAAHCRAVLERFDANPDRIYAGRTTRLMASVPTEFSGVDPERLVKLADRAIAGGTAMTTHRSGPIKDYDRFMAPFEIAKGMAEYRAGRFGPAAQWLRKGREDIDDVRLIALGDLYLAMACHRLGQREQGADVLTRVIHEMDQKHPKVGAGDLGPAFQDLLYCLLARREAEGLLGVRTADGNEVTNEVEK
jgi:hypothetical protein